MGEANPNSVVAMGQEMMNDNSSLDFHDHVLRSISAQRTPVNWVAADDKAPAKKKQRAGLKRLGPTPTKAESDRSVIVKVTTKPCKGKPLTALRKKKILEYNDRMNLNPDQPSSGGMGSTSWIEGLVQFMNESNHTPVAHADITHWLRKSKGFFHSELVRLLEKQKPEQHNPDLVQPLPIPNPATMEGGTLRPLAEMEWATMKPELDVVVPLLKSEPESFSDSNDGKLDAEAVMIDFLSLVEDEEINQPEEDYEYFDPESVFNSLPMWSPQVPSGIKEIKSTHEPVTIPSSTGDVLYSKHDVTSDLAQVPIAIRNLYGDAAIEYCGALNPMLMHLVENNQLPADKQNFQLFTNVLLKLVEKAKREGSRQDLNLEACLHTMRSMSAIVEGGMSCH